MSDDALVARVRERKTGELMMYAGLIKFDPENRGAYMDIISDLGHQLDACDRLLAGERSPEAEKIVSPAYRSRLSESELDDEDRFNMEIVHPIDPNDTNLSEYMLGLMEKAEALKQEKEGHSEAVASLKEELASCRDRIDLLASKLEYASEENAALNDEISELKEQLETVSDQSSRKPSLPDLSWVDGELIPISQLLDEVVESDSQNPQFYLGKLKEAQTTILDILGRLGQEMGGAGLDSVNDALGKVYVVQASVDITARLLAMQESDVPEETSAPEPAAEPEEEDYYEEILSSDEMQVLTLVELMKSKKIDYFVDMALCGRFNENACDDVVSFLKVDLSIIHALLAMDYHSRKSVQENFDAILEILGGRTGAEASEDVRELPDAPGEDHGGLLQQDNRPRAVHNARKVRRGVIPCVRSPTAARHRRSSRTPSAVFSNPRTAPTRYSTGTCPATPSSPT